MEISIRNNFIIVRKPPDVGLIKINVDVTVSNSISSVSVVPKNYKREIVSIQVYRGFVVSMESAEAYAMLKGVELGLYKRWQRVILEGDCQNVIKPLKLSYSNLLSWDAQVYIDVVVNLLLFKFDFISFVWTLVSLMGLGTMFVGGD